MRRYLFWSVLLSGCSSSDMARSERVGPNGVAAESSDTALDTGLTDSMEGDADDADPAVVPTWFALDAEIEMLNGLAQSIGLSMRVYGEDPSEGELEGCEVTANVDLFALESTTPDPTIQHWWSLSSVTLLESWSCGDPEQLPLSGNIGLGSFHPELNGRVLSLDVSEPSDFLYGFYGSLDFDPSLSGFEASSTYILGYGSTESTLAELEEVSLDGTLPDGNYSLVGVFLLPILP
ncbi:MAG: hypothetical protein VX519_07360 [Myxococcota bacterium]|nr:hypothetical protein [Myxococcota bacterium]